MKTKTAGKRRSPAAGNGKNRPSPGTVTAADETDRRLEKLAVDPALVRERTPVKAPGKPAIAMNLNVGLIDSSRFQPRREFPEAEIRDLADSIATAGLVAPIAVRPRGTRYELLAGERRLRAVKLLGRGSIRAEIQERSDAEARAIILAENLQRKDLSAIEQARAMRAMLDARDFLTQEDLGKALGVSQGQVSNTMRLLELPEKLQRRLISGEITVGQARAILSYVGHPRLLAEIDGEIAARLKDPRRLGLPPAEDFGELIEDVAVRIGRRLPERRDTTMYDRKTGRHFKPLQVPDDLAAELEIVAVGPFGGGAMLYYALNKTRYNALEAEDRKRQLAAAEVKAEKGSAKARKGENDKGPATAAPAEKVSPAEQKRIEEAERKREVQRRAEQARLTARKVHAWRINRLREAVAAALEDPATSGAGIEASKTALWFLVAPEGWTRGGSTGYDCAHDRERVFRSAFDGHGRTWPAIAALDAEAIVVGIPKLLAGLVWSIEEGPRIPIPDEVVLGMAEVCGVDVAGLWKGDQKGPAGQAYFELHIREQLVELGKELGVHLDAGQDKATMVRVLQTSGKVLALPKELGSKKGRGVRD